MISFAVCDGSCLRNPGPGGWAYILSNDGKVSEYKGFEQDTTNNRMELSAVIYAIKHGSATKIYTDSRYVVNGIKNWIHIWKVNDWRTSNKKPVLNLDLWRALDSLSTNIDFEWIPGHSDPLNYPDIQSILELQIRADTLARSAASLQNSVLT